MKGPNFKPDACPNCGYRVDSATEIHKAKFRPRPGDFSICLSCGALHRFDASLNLVEATGEDISELEPEQFSEVKKAQAIIQKRGPI